MSAENVALAVAPLLATLALCAWAIHPSRKRAQRRRARAKCKTSEPGEIYIDSSCCTSCGVPWSVAPELFEERDRVCAVRRQPNNVPELRRALKVFVTQDLGCVRYRGEDQRVVKLLTRVGCRAHCDGR